MDETIELLAETAENKMRLEDFLLDQFRGLSKIYLREIVKTERCEVNGRFENIGYRLRANDFIEITLDRTRENAMVPQDIPLDVVFEDDHLIVINKPVGMLVHPSHRDKTGTLLNALAFHVNRQGIDPHIRPGLIHRLDKETSGLIVAAKNTRTHRILATHFEKKLVEKRYLALVDGVVADDEGTITGAIGRFVEEKRWGIKENGRESETRFRVRQRSESKTLLELEPVTGRTNQLRIHCETIGHPIVGDISRGGSEFERLCLHAYSLAFRHPATRERVQFESAAPFGIPMA
ncbi:MAG: RluA family pseudouridine synthase [Pyrinomonadaceae bacterium]